MKSYFQTLFFLFIVQMSIAQTQFWSDNFEDSGAPSSGTRTPENNGGVPSPPYVAYFIRTDGSNLDNTFVTDGPYSGKEGSKFWAGEDHDQAFGTGMEEQQIEWTGIDISGRTSLSFKGLFAAASSNLQWDNVLYGNTHTDFVKLEYKIDAGSYTTLFYFVGDNVNSKKLREDTNSDGLGDGTILTKLFTEFTKSIPGSGNTLSLRLSAYSNNTNNEEWGIDNFRLYEVASNPEINVKGNTVSIIDGDVTPDVADHTDLGNVNVGNNAVRTYTIENTGSGNLNVSSITSSNALFTIGTLSPASPIPAGSSATFTVTFSPTATGVQNATITINNNDSNEAVYDYSVTGRGYTFASRPYFVACSTAGKIQVIVTGGAGSFTYSKDNGSNFQSANPFTGVTAGTYQVKVQDATGNISSAQSVTVGTISTDRALHFNTAISDSVDISGVSDAGYSNGLTFVGWIKPLLGSGTDVPLSTTPNRFTITYLANNDYYSLPNPALTSVGQTQSGEYAHIAFTITSGGSAITYHNGIQVATSTAAVLQPGDVIKLLGFTVWDEVHIWKKILTQSEIAAYMSTSPLGNETDLVAYYNFNQGVAGGNNSGVTTLTDLAGGDDNGTLTNFTLSGCTSNWINFTCPCVALTPEINVKGNNVSIADGDVMPSFADSTDFGNQSVCTGTLVRTYTIENTGTGTLNVTAISTSGGQSGEFVVGGISLPAAIAASGSTTFTVSFNPTVLGLRSTTLNITNDDSDENPYNFSIQGTGIDPEINLKGNNVDIVDGETIPSLSNHTDFDEAALIGGTVERTFTIQNIGTSTLNVSAITITGTHASDFTFNTGSLSLPTTIAASSNKTFTVTFDPSALGIRSAILHIANNDCSEADYDFAIQGTGTVTYSFSGKIFHMGNGTDAVKDVTITLSGDDTDSDLTGVPGTYNLIAGAGEDYVITPNKTINLLNGVDVGDATRISQHIAGNYLTDFYRKVSADANKSSTISTVDGAIIKQALLNNPAAIAILTATGSWRFVDSDFSPPGSTPFVVPSFPETRTYTGVTGDYTAQDFYGIKIGDVLDNANPQSFTSERVPPMIWMARDRNLTAGETVEVEFSVQDWKNIAAFQYAFIFDPSILEFVDLEVTKSISDFSKEGNFGISNIENGEIRVLFTVANGTAVEDASKVFKIRFKVLQSGNKLSDVLSLSNTILQPIAYTKELISTDLKLVYSEGPISNSDDLDISGQVELLQNRPNPFSNFTSIGFILPIAMDASLNIYDASGRMLWLVKKSYPAGYHEEKIRLNGTLSAGVYFYELTTELGSEIKRMIYIR